MNMINLSTTFSVNIAGLPIPKNSLFGKIGSTYWYIDDYSQFATKNTLVDIYIMTSTDKYFKKCIALRSALFIQKLDNFIKSKNLYHLVCIYPLKMGKHRSEHEIPGFIRAKQAQADFTFRPSNQDTKHAITDYACGKMPQWVDYK